MGLSPREDFEEARRQITCCQKVLAAIFFVNLVASLGFSSAALASCDFVTYTSRPGNQNTFPQIIMNNSYANSGYTVANATATVGLIRWNPNQEGCRRFDAVDNLRLQVAQICGIIAVSVGIVALTSLFIELIFCRFMCSRVIISALCLVGMVAQALTFIVYGSNVCFGIDDVSYPCEFGYGSGLALLAVIFFCTAICVSCAAPKPDPLVKQIMEGEFTRDADPCCWCMRKDKRPERKKKVSEKPVASSMKAQMSSSYPSEIYAEDEEDLEYAAEAAPYRSTNHFSLPKPILPQDVPKSSFANGEIVEDDLFFDSKTV